ncbi:MULTISPECIES: CotH kinase family protein [Niallia]|jgi:spore coat protein H|uniref:Spore coat protein n=1 Tax=Niallia circulans TaxID=1397 RepID=A0A0J1ID60_NIACI|nr:CotH kinase family protein [Niallia circulans]KLV23902.1 spore coat protein [Niallia circulans]MCM2982111.1 CotH kinase family protein [Niallia circulans]
MMKTYNIYIHPNDYKNLRKDIWSDDYVSGYLKEGKNKYLIGISYRGHSTRNHTKKSYSIVFQNPSTVNGTHEIHLNAESKDPSLIRSKLSLDFFNSIGVLSPQTQHVLLTINGQYRGIYLQIESLDEYLLRKRNLADGDILYATDDDANFSLLTVEGKPKKEILQGYTPKYQIGNSNQLFSDLLFKINTLLNLEFEQIIPKMLDIEKYLKWLAGVVCIQHFDGFDHNYAIYFNSSTNLFEISPWDCDGTWGRNRHGKVLNYDVVPIEGYNTLSARLIHIPAFRKIYKNILEEILNDSFTAKTQSPIIEELFTKIKPQIEKDPFSSRLASFFDKEKQFILSYIQNRNRYLSNQLKNLT